MDYLKQDNMEKYIDFLLNQENNTITVHTNNANKIEDYTSTTLESNKKRKINSYFQRVQSESDKGDSF